MPISCDKCNVSLPEVENFSYRFCPNCGAIINDEKNQSTHAASTIPPDTILKPRVEADNDIGRHELNRKSRHVPEHTLAPDLPDGTHLPPIKPPATPPPADFFRESTNEDLLIAGTGEGQRKKKHKIWIWWVLGIGAGTILVWWLLGF